MRHMINGNTFLELFKIQVSARGNKPALNDPTAGRQMTYAELDEYAGRVAAKMRENGVAHGDIVALVMPNSLNEAAAILAAMKLGAAVAPLNPLYPQDRLAYIYQDCAAKLIVTPDFFTDAETYAPIGEEAPLRGEDIAMLVYTSGSTGRPKGVVIDQYALAQSIHTLMTEEDVFGIGAPFFFIAGSKSLFIGLATGCANVLIPMPAMRDPDLLAQFLAEHRISVTFISPKVLRYFTPIGDTLRKVMVGSERLSGIWTDRFELYNTYGLSEGIAAVLQFKVDKPYDNTPVGKPLAGEGVYLLDEEGRDGDEGEICLTGDFARGYLNLPEETAKTFVPNPFKDRDGFDTMLKTGDLGRRLPDGNIVYLNRKDWMVKINGQRVEPGEIEAALRRVDGIRDAAVKDFEDVSGEVYLAGFYVSSTEWEEENLRDALKAWLPEYMLPARLVRLDRLPVNANGKLDRSALPKPDRILHLDAEDLPQTDGQRKLFDLVADVVGHRDFGIHTNLSRIGLSSIGVMRLTSVLSKAFGAPVSIDALRENPTVEALERCLSSLAPEMRHEKRESYPLSKTQEGILAETLERPDTTLYNVPVLIRLPESIDTARLQVAVDQAIAAHPYLSARIGLDDAGSYCIRRNDADAVKTGIIRAAALPDALVRPFDLLKDRLCRAEIYVTDAGNYLFLDCHHIAFDGTSFMILYRDIEAAYAGQAVEPEDYTGFDIALDEAAQRETARLEKARAYYEALLSDAERDMLPKGDVSGSQPASGYFTLASGLDHGAVREWCRKNRVTENAFYNAVFAFVLMRYNFLEEALYTTIYNGRKDSRMQRTVTMLVKTLPVVCRAGGNDRVENFVRGLGSQLMDSMAADLFSFAEISRAFNVNSDIMFAYQGDNFVVETLAGEPAEARQLETKEAKGTLDVTVFVRENRVTFECEYHADRYSEAFMRRFVACMETAAAEFLRKECLKDVSILDAEAEKSIKALNDTDVSVPFAAVPRMLEARAQAHPERLAVIAAGEQLTYGELNARANRIANALMARGVRLNEPVGMLLPRTVNAVAAEYGIMKAGGAFLPMLPDYPDDRIDYCMADSGSRFVLTTEQIIRERGALLNGKAFAALSVSQLLEEGDAANPDIDVPADALAYCIYTSGSTGRPKGVMIEHGNLCNFVHISEKNQECYHYVTRGSVALSVAALSFDFSLMEIHLSLANGMTLCMANEEEILNPLKLAALIRAHQVDVISGTPSFLSNLLDIPEAAEALSGIKLYDLGAEAFPPALYAKLRAASPSAMIVNGYGPTEATISCISKVMDGSENITIGRPAANVKAWIFDRYGHMLPPFARGELVIGGLGVGRGYVNLPEKTATVFLRVEGIRAYRTGDVARINGDGEIEFFGRLDNQVKLHGLRIELDEIENVMNAYPGIRRSVALVRKNEAGEDYLCAWFTAAEPVDTDDLKAFLARKLARYMVPAAFVQLEQIPMTQNGKVDKKKLPEPELAQEAALPPENEAQQKIFDCAAQVLGHDRFGVTTDLYDAGLSSLGAIRLNVLLSKAFGVPVSMRDLQENATVRALEKLLQEKAPAETYEILPDYPLTQTQNGILVESLAHPDTTIYNIPSLYRLSGRVELPRLKAAVEAAVNAHPYLKATLFADDEGCVRARRNDDAAPVVEVIQAPALPEELVQPFELMGGPLCRLRIYQTEAGNYLFMDFHHIVYDGASDAVLLEDINAAYDGQTLEKEIFTGFDLALEEEKLQGSPRYAQAKEWYDALLSDADREMLADGDVSGQAHRSAQLRYETKLNAEAVRAFCEAHGVTENAFFNAAFAFALSKFTGKKEALYTTIYNGRNDSRLDRAVAMLVKTFPVHISADSGQETAEFVSALGRQLVGSMNHDLYPFAEMARTNGISSDVLFAWQGEIADALIGGEEAESCPLKLNEAKAPLMLQAFSEKGRVLFHCEYHSGRYSERFMRLFAGCVEQAASELMARATLGDIRLATAEAEKEMDQFNATETPYPVTDIVTMFRAAAERYPDRTAVIFKETALTYRQLDDLSERIAGYLRANGVGRGSVVSILIPRCEYMAAASLGALKAGAAYQPLDPSYPSERLSFMMRDAACALLIADEALLEKVPEYNGPVLLTREIPSLPACETIKDHPDPEDLFILLYTSGSTGVPKGVMLEHQNLSNFCHWYQDYYKLDESCRVAAYASYGFDACMMDMYPALTCGACVCIVEEETRLDLMALEKWYDRMEITHAFMTTQVCRQFYTMASMPKLKYLSAGGEKLVPVAPRAGAPLLINGYGPTECTIFSTTMPVEKLYDRIPIGRPLANYKLYVVDENLRRLPPLVPGELLIAGRGVGRGYLNRPDLTGKAFIRNPFTDEPGYERAYRTGDVVRLLPDGCIDFIGRNDGQVKVRGFRVELTEVEAVIREFPGIADATVQAFEDEKTGEKYLAAYVVSEEQVDVSALNTFIRERKPAYMVPAVTMQIDAIPLNQNQKVNRRALPKPVRAAGSQAELVPPRNETEQKIFDCVADVVGHKDFGVTTDIYEAGLSSIGAIRLNVLLSKAFDVTVNSRDLKANPTVEKLEAFLTGAEKAEAFAVNADYGLTKTQEGVYVECVSKPDSTVYNVPILLKIADDLDVDRLKSAIVAAVNAHPILKTRLFLNDDGDVRMRRMDGDFSFDENAIPVRQIQDIEAEKAALVKPFKLLGGRLFRTEVLRGEGTWLFVEAHHIIADGGSLNILFSDISRAYAGEKLEQEAFTAYDVSLNEEKLRAGSAYDEAKAHYEQLLADAETVNLPAGDVHGANEKVTRGLAMAGATPAEAFKRFCDENRCSMNGLFSAAFGLTLDKYLGVDAAAFAGIYSGRNDSRFVRTVAMLVKTLPIVVTQHPGVTPAELAREITRQLADSQNSDIYSFAEISRSLHVGTDVMFAWQGEDFAFDILCGQPARMEDLGLSDAKAPINLNVVIEQGAIRYLMEYRGDLYSEAYMRGFVQAVDSAVNGLIRCAKLEEASILSPDAEDQLRRFNDTFDDAVSPTAPELFLKAVSAYGEKTAVIAQSGAVRLTYDELGRRARKVAGALLNAGVQPGERVALYMDRTADVYAIRQGIMLAGGAFVSLEPEYPDDRIAYILKDAGITRLVTEQAVCAPRAALFAGLDVMLLDSVYASAEEASALPAIDPDSPAYCIYTSGSTGKPKGVEILHRNLANLLRYDEKNTLAKAYVDNSTTFLALAAITFDVSIIEEMMPLFHGRAAAIATQEEIHNPLLLMRMVKANGVDMMKCTPSYLQTILDVPEAREALAGLNALIVGAEPFPAAMYARIREAGFQGTLFNSYGPTETCVSVCIGTLDGGMVTIGGPTLNTAFLIRDKFGNLLPPYARGELVIAGAQVGGGYIHLPEQTRDKFIHADWAGRTLNAYRSGDIAYFDGNGRIIHCGRNDNQVKIRGLRIELDGVENVMNSFPGIKRSVVLVRGEGEGKYLCGYYVSDAPVDEAALVRHMKQTLTAYMIPGVFVHLTELPLTVNGKVNKKALPEPQPQQSAGSRKPAATPLQQQIAEMFTKALGVPSVGVDEDFFEIGGTSMLASKVAMQAMVAGLPIVYQDIFAHPTVEALERSVLSKGAPAAAEAATPPKAACSAPPSRQDREIAEVKEALQCNTMEHIINISAGDLGHVLLTGATGFLGIHVLRELLENTSGKVTCLIRKGRLESARKRLESMLVYYFDSDYREAFDSGRLTVIDGDITDGKLISELGNLGFRTLINCAASVKHFASDDILQRVNVDGVKNLIALCEKTGSRLVQISTVSVAGENVNHALPDTLVMKENMLFFGQDLSNQYVRSKFDAEEAVLRAVSAGRLRGKIIRVGNLMSRNSDGEFQANFITSGFMRGLRGYAAIGAFPIAMLAEPVEFSPIDKVAEAVRLLAGTPDQFTVFHAVNGHWIEMGDVVAAMNAEGIPVDNVSDEEFTYRLSQAMKNEHKNMLVSGLISYLSSDAETVRSYVPEEHSFTKNALYRLGFRWPLTDDGYLRGAIRALSSLGFFEQ